MRAARGNEAEDLQALGAAIETVASVPGSALDGDDLARRVLAVEELRARLDAVTLALLGEAHVRVAWSETDPAAVSTASWLGNHTGQSRAVAGSRVRLGGRLRRMPATARALAAGEITSCHARLLARCLNPRTRRPVRGR